MGCGTSNVLPQPMADNIRNTISKIAPQKQKKTSKKIAKNFNNSEEFIQELKLLLKENEYYDFLFRAQYLEEMLSFINLTYVNHQQTIKIVSIVLEYMALSKNFINGRQNLPTSFKVNTLSKDLSQRWTQIKTSVHDLNKNCLKALNYLTYDIQEEKCAFSHSFLKLKFDFSFEEAIKVGQAVKQICKYNQKAFCYYSNYLLKCCQNQFQKVEDVIRVQSRLNNLLEQIQTIFINPLLLNGQESLFQKHPSFKNQVQITSNFSLNLSKTNKNQRLQAIENFILTKAKHSIKNHDKFNKSIRQICSKHGCFSYQSHVRLKSRSQKSQILKIKESFVAYQHKKIDFSALTNKNNSLENFINFEQQRYFKELNNYCQNNSGVIKFKIFDLLNSQCRFDDLNKLNQCCASLIKAIAKQGYKLIQLKNNLRGVDCIPHILLRLLIGEIICEFKLIFSYNIGEYYFSQYLHQISKQNKLSTLTAVKMLNQQLSDDYLRQAYQIITSNLNNQKQHKEKITFSQIRPFFKELISILPFKVDLSKKHHQSIDFNLIFDPIQDYKLVEEQFIDDHIKIQLTDKIRRIGEYLFYQKNFNMSELLFGLYQKEVEDHNAYLFDKIKNKQKNFIAAEIELLKSYSASIHFLAQVNKEKHNCSKTISLQHKFIELNRLIYPSKKDNVKIMKSIAQAYRLDRQYDEAIKIYRQCIEIEQKQESLQAAETHHLISVVMVKLRNFDEALKHQNIRFKIIERINKSSIQLATSLKDIAQIYKKSGNYSDAIKNYQQSKQIAEKCRSKYCKLHAQLSTEQGLLNKKISNYSKSLTHYQQALEIMQNIEGDHKLQTQKLYYKVANLYQQLGNPLQALHNYKKSLKLAKYIHGNHLQVSNILNSIGLAHQNLEQYEQSLASYYRCLQINKALLGSKNIQYIKVVINIGVAYDEQGKSKQALQKYRQSLTLLQAEYGAQNADYAKVINNIALNQHNQGHYQQALKHFKKCLQIKETLKGTDNSEYATTLSNMGMVYDDMCNYDEALKNYHKCLIVFQKLKNQSSLAATLNNIGTSYMHLQNYGQALKYYQKCLTIQQHLKGVESRQYSLCLHSIGIIKFEQNHLQQAEKLYEKAKNILKKHINSSGLQYSQILDSLGKLYLSKRQIDQSLTLFDQSLQILQKIKGKDDPSYISPTLNKAIAFFHLKNHSQSKQLLFKALRICQKFNLKYRFYAEIKYNMGIILMNQQKYYKAIKQFEGALILQQKYYDASWKLTVTRLAKCSSIVQRNNMFDIYCSYLSEQSNQFKQKPKRQQDFS